MLTMGQLKKWVTDTLSNSVEYTSVCTTTVGSKLNFYRSTPIDRVVEVLPFLTVFTDTSEQDFTGQSYFNKSWDIPIALGIMSNAKSEKDGTTELWASTDKAELLAHTALEILRNTARSCGINGEDVIITRTRLIVTEIGEADDVQANIFITFSEVNHI